MYQLKKWSLDDGRHKLIGLPGGVPFYVEIPEDQRHIFARGNVSGHSGFVENTRIHTGPLMKFEVNEEESRFLMETRSGSQYELKFADADVTIFEYTENFLRKLNVSEELTGRCRELSKKQCRKEEEELVHRHMQEADTILEGEELYLIFAKDAQYAYYRKNKEEQVKEAEIFVRRDMVRNKNGWSPTTFVDSYDIFEIGCEFKIYQGDIITVKPYRIEYIQKIWLKNERSCDVVFQSSDEVFLCKAGETKVVYE